MKRNGFTVMVKLIGLVKSLSGYMLLAITMGLIGHLMATFISILASYALLDILGFSTKLTVTLTFSLIILFALLRGVLRYGEQSCNHFIAFKLLALLRDKLFAKLRQLAPAKLEGKDAGDLMSLITSDIELLEVFYAHTISPIAIAVLFAGVMVSFIGTIDVRLAILTGFSYIVIGYVIPLITNKLSKDNGNKYRSISGDLSSYVLETLHGINEVLQFNQGEKRIETLSEKTNELLSVEEKMKAIQGLNTGLTNAVIFILDITMIIVSLNVTSAANALIASVAFMSSFSPFVALAALGSTLQNTFAAGNRLMDILEENPQVNEVSEGNDINFESARVNNVSFGYDDQLILDNVSLDIEKGNIIGLIGKSGCGKSTLLRLLMRFWQTDKGSIDINGININDINTASLRDNESFMTQDTHLFHDTIKNNLKIAKLDASDSQIIGACKKANIHEFIMSLENGYDTQVAELGQSLSVGERQRIGLARVFLHDAPLMLLDEPTSNLDSFNEAMILRSIYQQKKDKTVVLVSHKESTLKIANTIYRLDQGRVS